MKNILARLSAKEDLEERQTVFQDIRFISMFTEWVGVVTYIAGYLLLPPGSQFNHVHGFLVLSGMVLSLVLTIRCQTLAMLHCWGAVFIVVITIGFRLLENSVSNPAFWVLPVSIVISLTIAPLFNSIVLYLALIISVWLILGYGHAPFHADVSNEHWTTLIIGNSVVVGLMLNICLRLLRRKNFKAQQALEKMAFKDALTGINNRRSFGDGARKLQVVADGKMRYFLMIDIDDFKKINDTLGHDFGDQVLKKTADIIMQQSGPHLCGRLGGEEFGVIFTGDKVAACEFAAALVEAVYAAFHPTHAVSVSIGIAELIKDTDLSDSYRRADESLYCAKSEGKNRYVMS